MLHVLQSICEPGGVRNEDLIWHSEHCAVVLDGATSLLPTEFNSTWFVQEFISAFSASTERGANMCTAINEAIACVARHFNEKYSTAGLEYFPSAAGIFVCETDDRLQVISIGDCTAHFIMKNGNTVTVSSDDLTRFDNAVLDRMKDIHEEVGVSVREAAQLPEIREMLLRNRQKMNAPDGYTILSFNMQPVTEDAIFTFLKSEVAYIVMHSDGFDQLMESMTDPHADLSHIYGELREGERDDADFNAYPRFKPGDDASAMIIRVE
jgi:hypothetical protein